MSDALDRSRAATIRLARLAAQLVLEGPHRIADPRGKAKRALTIEESYAILGAYAVRVDAFNPECE